MKSVATKRTKSKKTTSTLPRVARTPPTPERSPKSFLGRAADLLDEGEAGACTPEVLRELKEKLGLTNDPKPAEAQETFASVNVSHCERLLEQFQGRLFEALQGYGVLRQGVPFTGIPEVPETLARMALDLEILRHVIRGGAS